MGGPTMPVIAEKFPHIKVNVVDINVKRIAARNYPDVENIPLYEHEILDFFLGVGRLEE
jgi:UDPglucose 6-dehydrogenase